MELYIRNLHVMSASKHTKPPAIRYLVNRDNLELVPVSTNVHHSLKARVSIGKLLNPLVDFGNRANEINRA